MSHKVQFIILGVARRCLTGERNAVCLLIVLLCGSAISQALLSSFPTASDSASSASISSFNLYCILHALFFPLPHPFLGSLALCCPVIICSGQFIFTSLSIPPLLQYLFLFAHLQPLHLFFYPLLAFLGSVYP